MTDSTISSGVGRDVADPERALCLRNEVVDQLVADGVVVTPGVESVMRLVPRELFAPGVGLDEVYELYDGLVTKRDEYGNPTSSVSAPHVQAHMLEQADIKPGMRVLEVGSGGYNAALLAELVGESGQVTTVDIDPEITDRASRLLAEAGYSRVRVVCTDAEDGVPEYAPYDRIVVTVGAWDVPPAWVSQLVEGGRLVVPLSVETLARVISFEKAGDVLTSLSSRLFGFVPMQGVGAHEDTLVQMQGGAVTLRFDEQIPVDPTSLAGVLDSPRVDVWTDGEATLRLGEPWADMQMWLATVLPGFCRVIVDRERVAGLIEPPGTHSVAVGVVSDGSLAYVTTRATANDERELGAHAFGPNANELAHKVAEQLRVWGRNYRGGPGPQFRVYPAGTPDDVLPQGHIVNKHHSRVTISWLASSQ